MKDANDLNNTNLPDDTYPIVNINDWALVSEIAAKFNQFTFENIDFNYIVEKARELSGAKYAVLNHFDKKKLIATTLAYSGLSDHMRKAVSIFGFELVGKVWVADPTHLKKMSEHEIIIHNHMLDLTPNSLSDTIIKRLVSTFNLGIVVTVAANSDTDILGNFQLFFTGKSVLQNRELVTLYARMTGSLLKRLNSEKKLQNEYRKLQVLSISSPDLLILVDENQKVKYINKVLPGFEMEKVIGDDVLNYVFPDYRQAYQQWLLDVFQTGETITREVKAVGDLGVNAFYQITFTRINFDGEGNLVYIVAKDITQQKNRELQLQNNYNFEKLVTKISEKFIQTTMDSLNEDIDQFLQDIGTYFQADRSYFYLYSDEGRNISNTHEWCNTDIEPKKDYSQGYPVDSNSWWRKELNSANYVNIPDVVLLPADKYPEKEIFLAQGIKSLITVSIHSQTKPVGFLGLEAVRSKRFWNENEINKLRNFCNLVGSVIQILESEKQLKDIISAVNENSLVSITDSRGFITHANSRFSELSGYTETELIGKNHRILNSGYHDKQFWNNLWKTISEGKIWKGEIKNRAKDGSEYWVSSVINPIKDSSGKIKQYISIRQDITERKNAEIQLAESEKFLSTILENIPNMIFIKDARDLSFLMFNKAGEQLLGYKKDDLLGKNDYDFFPKEQADYFTSKDKSVFEKNDLILIQEENIETKNGPRILSTKKIGILDNNGNRKYLLGISEDISERKKSALVLLESEKKFRELFENLIDEVHLWKLIKDETGKITGWQLVDANPSALKSWGKSIQQIIGKTANEIFGSDAHTQFMPIVEKIFKTGKPHNWQEYFLPTDQYLYMESIPFGDQFISTGKDITEQKKVEQALKESELRFSIAIEGTEAGIWDWDMVKNKVVFSIQWKAMLGYEDSEIENSFEGWKNLWHPEDATTIEKAVTDHMNGVSKKYEVIHRCRHKNGEWRWIMTRGKILRDNAGNPYRWIGTNVDITPQKQAEEDQKIAKEQAVAASNAKSEFLANMSHEIRTPLNGEIGFTDLLKHTQLSPVQQQYLDNANVSGLTLLGIINDILDFSKIEAGMLELESIKTDMIELLENSVDIVKFSAGKKDLELLLDIDPTLPRFANVDPIRLKQILANLLSNAIKFTHKGEVELKVSFSSIGAGLGKLSFFVRDTGIGISEVQKEKLFKAFSQADSSTTRKYGGTGLGLIISQMIAEKMGSRIQIDSIPDVGTTFYFEITTEFEEGEKPDTTKIADVKRCLIIDDNANNRLILELMLQQWEIHSDSCDSGIEAVKRIGTSQPYDVILCDYNMPSMNGLQTIRMIRDKLKLSQDKQPVILLHSSSEDAELHEKCKEMGVRFRLSKPVKSNDLFSYLSNLNQSDNKLTKDTKHEVIKQVTEVNKTDHSGEKVKILIAEDVSINMMLISTILSQNLPNVEIFQAENGLEALKLYKTNALDLIFMDIQMPVLDGIDATKQIREIESKTLKHVPIIALTAGALKEEKEKSFAAGVDDFVTKPILSESIQTVLKKHLPNPKKTNVDFPDGETTSEVHFGYNELVMSLGNEREFVRELITKVITDIPTKINQLEQACIQSDTTKIKTMAHSMKGLFLSMRCNILAAIAGKMEKDAMNNYLETQEVLLTEFKGEWEIVKNIMLQKIE